MGVARPAGADVEPSGDVREGLRQFPSVDAQRLELGDVGVQELGVDHRPGALWNSLWTVTTSTLAPRPPPT